MANFPNPTIAYPLPGHKRVCFIKNTIKNPNIEIGDFTYYDDPQDSSDFERNVLYHYDFVGDKLKIGKFCALATGVTFIMNGANHRMDTFSSFPFAIFGGDWAENLRETNLGADSKGDTVVGNDVWIGLESVIMPGVTIGDGAIVASKSVVVSDVPPYCIVGGNPTTCIRTRFDEKTVEALRKIRWWDWPLPYLTENIQAIFGNDIDALQQAHQRLHKDQGSSPCH